MLMAISFINPQPITKKTIVEDHPSLFVIDKSKRGKPLYFIPIASQDCSDGSTKLFERVHSAPASTKPNTRWAARVTSRCNPIIEKIAYDCYEEFGRGIADSFLLPKTRLFSLSRGDRPSPCLICRLSPDYQELADGMTQDLNGAPITFIAFMQRYHRPPDDLLTPNQECVPLKGVMALLAIGSVLGDGEVLGDGAKNVRFIWVKDRKGVITHAQLVKLHLGSILQAPHSVNQAPLANWNALTPSQKERFIATLVNCRRYFQSEESIKIFRLLLDRNGALARFDLFEQLQKQFSDQLDIYRKELQEYELSHPNERLRITYIDQ